MKKYALLSGVLVLAACGGGGGGGHHSGGAADLVVPGVNMPGDVQYFGAGGDSVVTAKSGDNRDADLFVFNLDNSGAIQQIVTDNRTYTRQGDKNEYVNVAADERRTINLVTLGREAGLSYADFGYAQEVEQDIDSFERDIDVFAGGYASKEVAVNTVQDATFKGTAVAYVEADMPDRIANKVSKTDDANLVVDANGNHTLTMNFSKAENPWYDVVYKSGGRLEFSGGENVAPEFQITDGMVRSPDYAAAQAYGDGGTASEVVYRVGTEFKDNATGRELEFDAAFGGKRQ